MLFGKVKWSRLNRPHRSYHAQRSVVRFGCPQWLPNHNAAIFKSNELLGISLEQLSVLCLAFSTQPLPNTPRLSPRIALRFSAAEQVLKIRISVNSQNSDWDAATRNLTKIECDLACE